MKKNISIVVVLIFMVCGVVFLLNKNTNKYDFTAQSINGEVNLKSFEGKNKIIYFGYTFCPDVCPATLGILSSVLNELKRDDIIVLFITLDPERDKVEMIDEYVKYFYPNSYGLAVKDLPQVTKNYNAKYQKVLLEKSAMEYSIAHSSSLYVIDKNGKFVSEISNLTTQNIKNTLEKLD